MRVPVSSERERIERNLRDSLDAAQSRMLDVLLSAMREEAFRDGVTAYTAGARDAGLTFDAVREVLAGHDRGEVSFGRVVELIRTTAHALAARRDDEDA